MGFVSDLDDLVLVARTDAVEHRHIVNDLSQRVQIQTVELVPTQRMSARRVQSQATR